MAELRIYRYTWGILNRIMADLKGYSDFDEFVKVASRRIKTHIMTFRDCEQYIIVSHESTTLKGSRILAFAKWNDKENKLEITKV